MKETLLSCPTSMVYVVACTPKHTINTNTAMTPIAISSCTNPSSLCLFNIEGGASSDFLLQLRILLWGISRAGKVFKKPHIDHKWRVGLAVQVQELMQHEQQEEEDEHRLLELLLDKWQVVVRLSQWEEVHTYLVRSEFLVESAKCA